MTELNLENPMNTKRILRPRHVVGAIGAGLLVAAGAVSADDREKRAESSPKVDLAGWPKASVTAAKQMMKKYGQPDEATASMLIWNESGPWKRTIVHREPVAHDFPVPHTDIIEQFIDYQVPVEKFDDLAAYDGSVIAMRTNGEVSARCGEEAMNFLAINLAADIAEGRKSVDEARRVYAETATKAMAAMKNDRQLPAYTTGFRFELPEGKTADPDSPYKIGRAHV